MTLKSFSLPIADFIDLFHDWFCKYSAKVILLILNKVHEGSFIDMSLFGEISLGLDVPISSRVKTQKLIFWEIRSET